MTRTVAVWKDGWLPRSETFVRDQIALLQRWSAIKIGYYRVAGGLVEADFAPYSVGKVASVRRYMRGVKPYLDAYQALMHEASAQLIHAHFGQGGVHALALAQACELPLVVTFHGQDATRYGRYGFIAQARYQRELREVFATAQRLLAVSEFVAEQLLRGGAPPRKVEVLYTGTMPTPAPSSRPRSNILFVGRLIEMKGLSDLIMALATHGYSGSHKLIIIGDGPNREEYEQLAARVGIDAQFLGWQSPSVVRQHMEEAAVFCAPSHATRQNLGEGFGMVYAEAAMASLPVVAYRDGGAREAVDHGVTGILVRPRDTAALAGAIDHLLSSPKEREQLGLNARKRALSRFNIVTQTAKLESIYDSVTKCR